MFKKIANLQDVYFQWLHYFQMLSLFKYLGITIKSMMHGPSLYISHSLTTDTSPLLDLGQRHWIRIQQETKNETGKEKWLSQTCAFWERCLGNLTHVKRNRITHVLVLVLTMRTRWVEPEEALPKQRTEWEASLFSSTIPAISRHEKRFCVSSEDTRTASMHATTACTGQKPPSWYLRIYMILQSCIHWLQRKVFGACFSPSSLWNCLPPEELGPPLSKCTHRPGNGRGHTYQNPAFNNAVTKSRTEAIFIIAGVKFLNGNEEESMVQVSNFTHFQPLGLAWVFSALFSPLWSTPPDPGRLDRLGVEAAKALRSRAELRASTQQTASTGCQAARRALLYGFHTLSISISCPGHCLGSGFPSPTPAL